MIGNTVSMFVSWSRRSSAITLLRFNLSIRVLQLCQVGGAGLGVQLHQQSIVERLRLEARDAAVGIVRIAEDDGLGGTGHLTRGHDLTVSHLAIFFLRGYFRGVDPLHAVSAFL